MQIEERGSTHVYRQIKMLTEEQLVQRESRCVHGQPAYCIAACPLKLDVKALLRAVAGGDLDGARKLYDRIAPFPGILSAGCGAPCEAACKLGELGDSVSIRDIERAVTRFGARRRGTMLRMKKKKTVALFGSGRFALFLAGELHKKAYPLTVFCAEADAAAFLNAAADGVPADLREIDLRLLLEMDIRFVFQSALDRAQLDAQRAAYDLVCLSPACYRTLWPDGEADPALLYDPAHGVVAGLDGGVLDAAFAAKRAARTVDRLAQGLDPAGARGAEGAVETHLYTNTDDITRTARVPCDGAYDRDGASSEAKRCIQCECDECIRGCAYLRHYRKSPRVLTREIYNNVGIIMGDHMMNKPINACALCGQCTVTCPNGYDMAEICQLARKNMVATDKMPLAPHEFALLDMLFSNNEAFLCRPQPGFETCRYVFFPGCQAAAVAPGTVRAAYLDLCTRLSGGVGLILGCCGVIADWAGRDALYDQTRALLDRSLARLGDPIIIAGCPTCAKALAAHPGADVVGVWSLLCEIGLPEGTHAPERPLALHDACGARGDAATQAAIRMLAARLGCRIEETEYSGDRSPCCGYGGLAAYANREVAAEMTQSCLARSDAPYLTYCMACRDRFARAGRESRHILELIYGAAADEAPDISQKRDNRRALKRALLRELWQEEQTEMKLDFEVLYTDDARRMMDARMILTEDVAAVLQDMRETGEAIFDGESGLTIARKRIGNTTFWVKFTREGDAVYRVHSAYSHRMNVVRRQS